jgi:hypothetical protein
LPQGQTVRLDHRHGNITVRTHAERELQLQASIRVSAPDKQEAAQFGNQIQILVDQTATGVSIRTQYPQENGSLFSGRRNISFSVNYDLLMPADTPLTVKNSFGNVSVTGLKANGDITNAHGLLASRPARESRTRTPLAALKRPRMSATWLSPTATPLLR